MFTLKTVTKQDLGEIQELWELNRLYHEVNSTHFGVQYQGLSFAERMAPLDALSDDHLRLTFAIIDNKTMGYCLSTIKNNAGELFTMHVHESCRGKGIGQALVGEHINWFKQNHCITISVHVDCSNKNTIAFYEKMGFYPNTMVMQQLP